MTNHDSDLRTHTPLQVPDDELTGFELAFIEAMREDIPRIMEARGTSGLNIAVARGGRRVWEEGFGCADDDERIPMSTDTVGHAGSVSKLYTAVATLQLLESGALDLYAPANSFIDGFELRNPLGEREITIYDLLTMRSGLATDLGSTGLGHPESLEDYLRNEYSSPMLREYGGTIPRWSAKVGTTFQYSNLGIATLGHIVERCNADSLAFVDYVQRYLFEPLGMHSSTFLTSGRVVQPRPHVVQRLSTGYARFGGLRLPTPTLRSACTPANGLLTTPGDHVRFLTALSGHCAHCTKPALRADTLQRMLTPQAPFAHSEGPYNGLWTGLSVMIGNVGKDDLFYGHNGAHFFGWCNETRVYPHLDVAIAVFANKWEMLMWHNPGYKEAPTLVCDYAGDWLLRNRGKRCAPRRPHSWAWSLAYVVGLVTVERLHGLLGIAREAPVDLFDDLERRGREQLTPCGLDASWDANGFRSGVEDMLRVDMTPAAINSFLLSDRIQVPLEKIQLISLYLGGAGDIATPLSFWPHAPHQPLSFPVGDVL